MTLRFTRMISTSAAAMAVAGAALLVSGAHAQLPDAIAALDSGPLVTFHAEGAQIYDCKADKDGKLTWTFREPIASLMLDGHTVGRHYAGPTWEHSDGSSVKAKVVGSAPGATTNDIPWLKLDVTEHHGSGTLSNADVIQRLNTQGGVLNGACDHAGSQRSVGYAADYVFRRKDK
jgi:hypothetical protein